MSSEEAKVPDPSQPMTIGMFQTAMANIGEEVKEAFRIRDDAAQKQGEQIQQQLNQFASTLREIVDYVKRPSDQAVSRDPSGKVAEYSNSAQMVAQAIKEIKQVISGEPTSELDSMAQLLSQSILREAIGAGKLRIRRALRAGTLLPEEVEAAGVIIEDKIASKVLKHGP